MQTRQETAQQLNAARRSRQPLSAFPGQIPPDLASAYALQEAVIADAGEPIVGWKLGLVDPDYRQRYDAERLIGPVFRGGLYRAVEGAEIEVSIVTSGGAAVEAEFAVLVDWDPALESTPPADRIQIFSALEILGGPLGSLSGLGPGALIGDRGNNSGIVIGRSLGTWADLLRQPSATFVEVDGRRVGTGGINKVPSGVPGSLALLVAHLAGRGRRLSRGDWVLTGATTGAHPISPGQTMLAGFEPGGSIVARAVAG